MPKGVDSTTMAESKSLTILLNDDHVFYYNGDTKTAMKNDGFFKLHMMK